jgi:hypothetical protein
MKDNKDVAIEFVRAFANADLDSLRQILAPDLKSRGPLPETDRAETTSPRSMMAQWCLPTFESFTSPPPRIRFPSSMST